MNEINKSLGCLCVACGLAVTPAAASPTNVLLIIADDLGIDSLAAFNSDPTASLPPTPTIDGIQAQGIAFTRFYAYPTCSPTRGAIMTGRYAFRTGILSPDINTLPLNEFTLPEALIASNSISNRLACIGKWHLGSDADWPNTAGGWPHFAGHLGGGLASYTNWPKTVNGVTTQGHSTYATTDNVDDSIAWIGEQGTNSWFLWVAFNAPHTPHHRPPDDLHDYHDLSEEGAGNSRPHFEAMVQAMDTELARLLSHVDLATTTVLLMGDNGTLGGVAQPPIASDHAKGTIYEGGIRVPFLAYGAAVNAGLAGTTYENPLHACDLYATILALFGADADALVPSELVLDSRSFAAVLRGESYLREPADIISLNEFAGLGHRSITEGAYKYIDLNNGTGEFYNVVLDLPEATNLLDGALSAPEQTALDNLQTRLAGYVNTPRIVGTRLRGDGKLALFIGWFANEGFTLWRTEDLQTNGWTEVPSQEFLDTSQAFLVLRDPTPPDGAWCYRVTAP